MIRKRFAGVRIDAGIMLCVPVCGRSEGISVCARPDPVC